MGKVVGSRFGFRTVLSFVPESGVCRSYKSVPFPERLPQISGNGMKDGFEEIEHEFPFSTFRPGNRTTCSDVPLPLEIFHLNDPKNLVTPIY